MSILFLCLAINVFPQKLLVKNPVRFLVLGDSYTIGQGVAVEDRWPNQLVYALNARGIQLEKQTISAKTGWRTDHLANAIKNEKPDSSYPR